MARTKTSITLNDTDHMTLLALVRTMAQMAPRVLSDERTLVKHIKKLCKKLETLIKAHMGEEAMIYIAQTPVTDALFRKCLYETSRGTVDDFKERARELGFTEDRIERDEFELLVYSTKRVVKLYEWGTGRSVKNGEQLRKGGWDGRAE